MTNIFQYRSKIYDNIFKFELDILRKEALVSNIEIRWDQPVDVAVTIKNACQKLEEKYGIKKIIQQIDPLNLDHIKSIPYFKIVNYNDNHGFYNIVCDIEEFPIAFMRGLGFE